MAKRKTKDPKVGTGKKPKGSGRRLYTDENPKDTVSIKYATPADARATVAKEGDKIKTIRFGQQGKKVGSLTGTAGKPKKGESKRMKAKRKSFKARHGKNIKKGKMSAAYWADKVKW